MRSAKRTLSNTRRFLGHPSVGGRLTDGAAGLSSQGTAVLHARASVQVARSAPLGTGSSRCVRGHMCVAEIAKPRSAKQTHPMKCPSSLAAVEWEQLASVVFGSAALKPCLPAPNLPVKRTG